jgi:hypothetical protein
MCSRSINVITKRILRRKNARIPVGVVPKWLRQIIANKA